VIEQSIKTATGEADVRLGDKVDDRVRDALRDIAQFSGLKAIEFNTHPKFADTYILTAKDEAAVRSAFTSSVLDQLLKVTPAALEGQGTEFLYYRPNELSNEDQVSQLMSEAQQMLALLSAG
jgi:hypothetical protein